MRIVLGQKQHDTKKGLRHNVSCFYSLGRMDYSVASLLHTIADGHDDCSTRDVR